MMTTTPRPTQPQIPARTALASETGNGPGRQTAMPFSKEDPRRQQKLLIAGIGGAAVVIALALRFVFRPGQRPAPRLNEEPSKVAQLLTSPDFQKMPFERREIYMKMMDKKKAQMTQAYANGQMSDADYQKVLEAAHLGKRLDEMRKYFS